MVLQGPDISRIVIVKDDNLEELGKAGGEMSDRAADNVLVILADGETELDEERRGVLGLLFPVLLILTILGRGERISSDISPVLLPHLTLCLQLAEDRHVAVSSVPGPSIHVRAPSLLLLQLNAVLIHL